MSLYKIPRHRLFFISRCKWGHSLSPEKGSQSQSQRWSETICLCVSWAGWRRCYLLSVSPLWPLTDQMTGMTGRRLSGSQWLPLHCLESNSRQLAWSSWGWYVCFACVHVCKWGVFNKRTNTHRNVHTKKKEHAINLRLQNRLTQYHQYQFSILLLIGR